ncbi:MULTISPECIES: FAS1-like dehydratase domain-containing protein [Pandoraea]|nr:MULTISPECIES: MaoC family dehydratase N-terminal domain-containing protein [Pandoraea]ALS65151.1 hypothetical protein AT395_09250 [Pandoraea apista]RRW92388.1 hypothetical protein EGJ54_20170 [Pandoraea apista]RRX01854.1 hypothetical protein EGJ56_15145 [Pandoraea apista]CFB65547.1 hypothetical protein LMG16407_04928 [Pandoraea apista]
MAIDYASLMGRRFPVETRCYGPAQTSRVAVGFGAGMPGELRIGDTSFLGGIEVLPMMALALADGQFWQKSPDTGIDWQRIVHAEESLTMHRPLPTSGELRLTQKIDSIHDRGVGKGAVMRQIQTLANMQGQSLATITVTTLLKGDGGFGGEPPSGERVRVPDDRAPDATLAIRTPPNDERAIFRLDTSLAVAAGLPRGKAMMRGLGCFGLAGRGVMHLVCGNRPARLRHLALRYVGPMLTDETMWLELWHTGEDSAVFRMSSRERSALVVDGGRVEFLAAEAMMMEDKADAIPAPALG